VSEVDELKALVAQQQKRIERLELALVLACPPNAMVSKMWPDVVGPLDDGEHVWLQPFRDSDGHFFLRVESSKKGKGDGGS
jgi:hypothetical protein